MHFTVIFSGTYNFHRYTENIVMSKTFYRGCTVLLTVGDFKVTDAILQRVQNNWGERKLIYSKCMEKVGSLMFDNSRKVDILQFLWITNQRYQLKEFTNQIWEMKSHEESCKLRFWFFMYFSVKPSRRSLENLEAFVWKTKNTISHFSASPKSSNFSGNIFS